MIWQYTPYTLGLLVAAGIMVTLAAHGVRSTLRDGPDRIVLAFVAIMIGTGLWATGYAFGLASVSFDAKFLWRTIGYVGHNVAPISLLVFCLLYAGYDEWVTRRTVALLAVEPFVAGLVVAPTNPLHHLMWSSLSVRTVDSVKVLAETFGPWYWVNTAYNYTLVVCALYVIALSFVRASDRRYRGQAGMLLFGVLPALVANVAWVVGLTALDFTPFAFTVTGLAFGTAVFRFQLLDLVPIARSTVVEGMRDGYVVLDENDRIVDANPVAMSVLDSPTAVGEPATEVFPPGLRPLVGRERDDEVEFVIDGPHGQRYYDAQVTTLSKGTVTGRLLSLRDVTDRRSVERRFRLLIEHSSDLITVLDAGMTITYASLSTRRVMGYEPADLTGTNVTEIVHPDDAEHLVAGFVHGSRSTVETAAIEFRVRHADGSWRWIETKGRDLSADPTIGGMICNSRDITERKRRERELERQNERLDEFASVVSHDLRNPLNVIDGYLALARETGDLDDLDAIERAADRMTTIVDGMLALARQGRAISETETVLVERVVTDAWELVDTKRATLNVASDLASVAADRSRLQELFENLFRNAIEHAGENARITVGAVEGGFFVADDGPGIPPKKRETVFEHGYTTSKKGTGFGLAIVRTIAEAHGWTVRAGESADGGARFEVVDGSGSASSVPVAEEIGNIENVEG